MFVAVVAVLTWWACNAFIPLLGSTLAAEHAARAGLSPVARRLLAAGWQARASNAFNFGGLLGALAAIRWHGCSARRVLFVVYFLFSAAVPSARPSGSSLPPQTRLALLLLVGAGVYGVFGLLTFYLPELFPARLRATGAGFCYNIGRVFAAAGPRHRGNGLRGRRRLERRAHRHPVLGRAGAPDGRAPGARNPGRDPRPRARGLVRLRCQRGGEFEAVTHRKIRRRQLRRPGCAARFIHAVLRPAACAASHVQQRIVARRTAAARGATAQPCGETLETPPGGLGRAELAGVQRHAEQVVQADAAQVRVAVTERAER